MNIAVFGLGYVGAVTAAVLAGQGHRVVGVDIDAFKVDLISRGVSPILEPGLPELIAEAAAAGRLTAATNAAAATDWQIAFVCVGTPAARGGQTDMRALLAVLADIARQLQHRRTGYPVIAIRSTVAPHIIQGTLIPHLASIAGRPPGQDYGLVATPEFLREGTSVDDFLHPPFTVIGADDPRSADVVEPLFRPLPAPIHRLGVGEAMMVKYASNAFHALKVAFANEIGAICSQEQLDGLAVMETFCRDTKLNISTRYLRPGFAFGGSCLPKDLQGLTHRARQLDLETPVLSSILPSNRLHLQACINHVMATGARRVGVLGISFKPGTDDLRDSPMIALVEALLGKGYDVSLYDRNVNLASLTGTNRSFIEHTIPHIASLMKPSVQDVLDRADVVVTSGDDSEFAGIEQRAGDRIVIHLGRPGQVASLAPA